MDSGFGTKQVLKSESAGLNTQYCCVSGKILSGASRAGLALKGTKTILLETQRLLRNPGSRSASDFADLQKMPILSDPESEHISKVYVKPATVQLKPWKTKLHFSAGLC